MRCIEPWLGIAIRAFKISRLANDPEAEQILQMAVKKLTDAGYPLEERTADGVKIELSGHIVPVAFPKEEKKEETEEDPGLQEIQDLDENAFRQSPHDRQTSNDTSEAPQDTQIPVSPQTQEEPAAPEAATPVTESATAPEKTAAQNMPLDEASPAMSASGQEKTDIPTASETPVEAPELSVLPITDSPEYLAGYKEHLRFADLVYAYHFVKVLDARKHIIAQLEIISSPLSMKPGMSNIMAWLSNGSATDVKISTPKYKGVILTSLNLSFIVRGSVNEAGEYKGTVKLTKPLVDAGMTIQYTSETNHGNGHIRILDDGVEIRLIPLRENNGTHGNAQFYYLIRQDGQEDIIGDNVNTDQGLVPFEYHGNHLILAARWKDRELFAAVGPTPEGEITNGRRGPDE